jgi:succinate dehydrogenase / fumarate reductase cytochrome b subunit
MNMALFSKQPLRLPSIMVKAAMALSGLGLALWVTLHMLGNLLWFGGPEVLNGYAHKLRDAGLVWPVRVLLCGGLLVHVLGALLTTRRAQQARPVTYKRVRSITRVRALASHSMRWTGVLLAGFIVYHVATLYGVGHPTFVPEDVHHNVSALMRRPGHALALCGAALWLGLHLQLGLASGWITLGVVAQRRAALVRRTLAGWALLVTLGFLLPLIGSWL